MSSSSAADSSFAVRRRRVQRRRRLRRLWIGRAAFALVFALTCGALAPALDFLHRVSIDVLFVARHTLHGPLFPPQHSDVVVVVIDEETYSTPPFKTLPRVAWTPQMAAVIEAIDTAGARMIGYDLIDPTTLGQAGLITRYDTPLLRAFHRAGNAGRLILAEARLSGQTLTPFQGQRRAVGGDDNIRIVNLLVDDDAVVRRQKVSFASEGGGEDRLTFAVEIARRAGAAVPADDYVINFNTGPDAIPSYALADMFACAEGNHTEFFARAFRDKIVLIGTRLDFEDRHYAATWLMPGRPDPTKQTRCILPGDPERFAARLDRRTTDGVLIHAASINTLTKGLALRELGPAETFALVALAALSLALLFFALSPLVGAAAGIGWLMLLLVGALQAFRGGVIVPAATLAAIAALGFATVYAYRFVIEDRERRRISHAFRHYLSPDIVERLAADPGALRVGGERRRVTVMFADVVGYTALTERLGEHPERLVEIMNRFLGEASVTIERQAGYVDKFIGDALMAVWGAPLDDPQAERHAVLAALDLRDAMAGLNAELGLAASGLPPLGIRIGLNSGVAIAGNMGGPTRLNYTVTGDVVNLASRFEGANKFYGTTILIGEETAARLGPDVVLRPLERVVVKGRSEPVGLYEVIDRAERIDAGTRQRLECFAAALASFAARDFAAAEAGFGALADDDACAALFAGRAARYAAEPPPADWSGSLALDSK